MHKYSVILYYFKTTSPTLHSMHVAVLQCLVFFYCGFLSNISDTCSFFYLSSNVNDSQLHTICSCLESPFKCLPSSFFQHSSLSPGMKELIHKSTHRQEKQVAVEGNIVHISFILTNHTQAYAPMPTYACTKWHKDKNTPCFI